MPFCIHLYLVPNFLLPETNSEFNKLFPQYILSLYFCGDLDLDLDFDGDLYCDLDGDLDGDLDFDLDCDLDGDILRNLPF